jgi:hypothetical protein
LEGSIHLAVEKGPLYRFKWKKIVFRRDFILKALQKNGTPYTCKDEMFNHPADVEPAILNIKELILHRTIHY